MAESTEAKWLRENWGSDTFYRYENQWIAVEGNEVIASGENIDQVMDEVDTKRLLQDRNPLYAFVYFRELQ